MASPRRLAVAALLPSLVVAASCSSSSHHAASPTSASPTTTAGPTSTSLIPPASTTAPPCAVPAGGAGQGGPESSPPGDIPDNQAYVSFTSTSGGYKLDIPEGWARQQSGTAVIFTDKFNTITVEVTTAPTAPSVATVQSTIGTLASTVACFKAGSVTQVTRNAGTVVRVTYEQSSPPNQVTGKTITLDVERYEYWHAGKEAIVTLSSSHGSDNVDPWRRVTDSFAWTP